MPFIVFRIDDTTKYHTKIGLLPNLQDARACNAQHVENGTGKYVCLYSETIDTSGLTNIDYTALQ